ncbi:MAG: cytochrome c-type biogenesis CcmF C-terminal domain-containing protein [bacterium]
MSVLGGLCLILLAIVCFVGLALALAALLTRRRGLMQGAVGAVYGVAALAVIASIVLLVALLTRDFSLHYVYNYTSRSLSLAYTISAFWAGNAGSLLLWLLLLAIFSLVAIRQSRREDASSAPYVTTILLAITAFFSLLILFGNDSNPFVPVSGGVTPADGLGMNPQLLNIGMVIHPGATYLGYVAFAIPFAVVMGGLLARSPSAAWLPAVRRWTLVGWFFLTIGNLVGAWWAYVTLGWGGYWAWDPVENASLMPWLTSTAMVHALIMLRKRQMLSAWMVVLAVVTFLLTIFGTFLTRSGIATSVHAFSDNTFIPWFTIFMLLTVIFSAVVMIFRLADLRSAKSLDNPLSRESAFLYTNLALVVITFVVLWGVLFPVFAGALRGAKVELDPNFFTVVTVPLGLILMLLTGLCPLLPWRGRDRSRLVKDVAFLGGIAVVALVVLLILGLRRVYPLLSFTLATFAAASIALQYGRGWRNRRAACGTGWLRAFGGMIWTNRSRYGGFLIHLGVIVVLVGITGSYAFKQVVDGELSKGGSLDVGRYELTYEGFALDQASDREVARATFTVSHDGRVVGQVNPVQEYYPGRDELWTRVDIHSTLAGDLYVSLLGFKDGGAGVTLKAEIHPLVSWLWIGGGVMFVGGLIVLWPVRRSRARGRKVAPAARSGRVSKGVCEETGVEE